MKWVVVGSALLLPFGLAPPVAAQEAAAAIKSLQDCRAIAADAARLACFDRAAASFTSSVEKKELVILDRGEMRKTKRSLFGFNLPKLPFFGNDRDEDRKDEPEFTQIESEVTRIRGLGYGKVSFTIEDGAVWQTTEAVSKPPRIGDPVTIKRGMVTNYFIRFGNGRPVRGMRVN